jgi:hypothetical protein
MLESIRRKARAAGLALRGGQDPTRDEPMTDELDPDKLLAEMLDHGELEGQVRNLADVLVLFYRHLIDGGMDEDAAVHLTGTFLGEQIRRQQG